MSKHKSRSSSKNYRMEEFVMFIMRAEVGIQEAATLVPTIRDGDVTNALNRLLRWLETSSELPHIPVGEVKDGTLTIDAGKVNPSDLIAARIVNNWHIAMEEYGERSNADLAGCLRVILDSVRTWTRGPKSRGYLAYAAEFLKKGGVEMKLVPSDGDGKPLPDSAAVLPEPPPALLDDLSLEELTARWREQPANDDVLDAFLHRALYYLVSGRAEELIAHLTPLAAQARNDMQRAQMLWVLGRAYLKLERGLMAVDALRRAVNLEAQFVEAWIALAEAYQTIGSHRAAAHAWEQARALDRKRVEIYPPLAATYHTLGDVASEIATWERFVATAGRSLFARYELAQAYRRVKRDADAARELARVRKMEPAPRGAAPADWAVWLRMQIEAGRINQSDSTLERAHRRGPEANWFIPLIALAAAEMRGDPNATQVALDGIASQNQPWDASRREIEPILREILPPTSRVLKPLRADAPTMQLPQHKRKPQFSVERAFERANELTEEGNRYLQRHDYAAAERAFLRALEIGEGDATLFGLGLVCAMTNRTEEAFHFFTRAVRVYADDADFWYNLAMAAERTFRISRALQAFERCLELGVKERDLKREVEEHIRILRQGVADLQKEWGKPLSREEMIRHEDLFARGVQAMEQGELTRAVELFREAVTVNERHHQSWGNLGACLLQRGELDEGEQALRQALSIKPDYEFAQFNLESLAAVRASGTLSKLPILISNKPLLKQPGLRFRDQNKSN
jgi:tetratricopeptide (TPR) repeat protein